MKKIKSFIPLLGFTLMFMTSASQICGHPLDTVYGLNSITGSGSGQIVALSVNNAGSANIGSPAAGSANANGLGYSAFNNKFYFFNQTGGGVTEFVSFNPVTGSKIALAAPPATLTTAQKIRSGTIDSAGTRYYTINPNAAVPYFYYYSIGTGLWTTITSTFKDKKGNTITDFKNLNSGDMTFDGAGNLWVLCSNSTQFALYKIKAPVPTTAVASITADTILPIQNNPVSGVSFTGIAFNSTGKLYLTTGSGVGVGNNKMYSLPTPTSPITLVGSVPNGYGDDLTTCTYPINVLGMTWAAFSASLQNNSVVLSWTVNETDEVTGYQIETSTDADHWEPVAKMARNNMMSGQKKYSFSYSGYAHGKNFFRIIQQCQTNRKEVSETRLVDTKHIGKITIGPNPVSDVLYFYNKDLTFSLVARIFDRYGRLLYSTLVSHEQHSINVNRLPKGNYILTLSASNLYESTGTYHFIKW